MRTSTALVLLVALTSCVAPGRAPPEPPPLRPAPPPPAPTPSQDWRDVPISPGDWSYAADVGGTAARYGAAGAASFVARCDMATHLVTLSREGVASAEAPVIDITTSSGRQTFRGQSPSGRQAIAVALAARDPFLDKMAFSRGRFVVAVSGTERLVVPSWPEFARVVEDCRG